jgi:AcrR family transcriptional regulator
MDARNAESAARRRCMIDAAIEVLGEVGARGLTMEMVAERCDMATRTLYNHFPTRDVLVGEALETLLDAFRDALAVEVPKAGTAQERLGLFVGVLFRIYEEQGAALVTLLANREDEAIGARTREMRAWRRRQLELILRSAKDGLRPPLKEATALAVALTNHATWMTLTDECGLTPQKARERIVDALDAALFSARA